MRSEREARIYKIRPELEYSSQTHRGQSVLVVKDPATDRYFRFTGAQATVLELLREPTDLEQLARRTGARLGTEVPVATIGRLLDSLASRNLLDTPEARAGLAVSGGARGSNWLYLKLFSLDAHAAFEWLAPRTAWCFTPAFHLFAAAMIFSGLVITTIHAGTLIEDAFSLLSVSGIVLIWLVVVGVGILHELAHGVTCRHFGGTVKELGFMLIYFQPAFYCDVSDSWMFPSRRERMWVTFAGGYFQLVVWGMAAIVWRIFAQDTAINWIAMTVLVFSGLQTLINFNPLIKLDGYYMLSDYLEIPNLRDKAFQAVRSRIAGTPSPLLEGADRRSLVTFGTLSLTFSTLLLLVVYVNIYLLATSYFAFAGLTAFVLFAGFTLRRTGTEQVAGARALVKRAGHKKYRNLAIAAGFVLLTLIVPWKLRIPAEFTIQPAQSAIVRANTGGIVDEVLVYEGMKIHRGQEAAHVENSEKRERYLTLEREFNRVDGDLRRMQSGPRTEEIAQAEAAVEIARQQFENASRNTDAREALTQQLQALQAQVNYARADARGMIAAAEEGLAPRVEAEKAQERVNELEAAFATKEAEIRQFDQDQASRIDLLTDELNDAESRAALVRAGAREDEKLQTQQERDDIYAQMMQVGSDLYLGTIVAPITGTVVTQDMDDLEGTSVVAGEAILEIQQLDTMSAELLVSEKDLADVQPDSPVVLVVRGYPGRRFRGQVDRIGEIAREVDGQRFVRVTAQLDNEEGLLKAGTTGHAKIEAGWYPIAYLATHRLFRWIRTDLWALLP